MLKPYDMLLGLALLHEKNMRQADAVQGWSGVLVQAADKRLLIEQGAIHEIITSAQITRVIDHRDWLVGLFGYEGTIIPMIELRTLLQPGLSSLGLKDRSLLVITQPGGPVGLLVDKVLGRRNYWSDDELSGFQTGTDGCSKISFLHKGQRIEVCDIERLANRLGVRKEAA